MRQVSPLQAIPSEVKADKLTLWGWGLLALQKERLVCIRAGRLSFHTGREDQRLYPVGDRAPPDQSISANGDHDR
jgi:hypothetical protein